MLCNQIRNSFLEFFAQNEHKIIPSSALVPHDDPSLMFTNSGMVQFKNYFTGTERAQYKTVATSQKCLRAGGKHNDLENVGYTARHHTFFEMLGNFAFEGAYFKEKAILLAWEYLTEILCIAKQRLYITIYHEDDEAYNIWHKITGFDDSKIIRVATSDNFWSMGNIGPCGPCSEIFFDHGEQYKGSLPGNTDASGDRYVEIWNLVFMQYEQLNNGTRCLLPKPAIDTGMGLERIAAVIQGVKDNYDIDSFHNIIQDINDIIGLNSKTVTSSHKVIADHIRSSCFLIADGVMPSNDGAGYVLRRIMRRAMRHVQNLGYQEVLLHKLAPALVKEMGSIYKELYRAEAVITSVLRFEEEKFHETLERGLKALALESANLNAGEMLSGEAAFKLYDTYGFPLDLTKEILREQKILVDEANFDVAMQKQRVRARAAWTGSRNQIEDITWYTLLDQHGATTFLGYDTTVTQATILAIIVNNNIVQSIASGSTGIIVANKTPFYAESGGQLGDTGFLGLHKVIDTKKYAGKIFGHTVIASATIKVGDVVTLSVDIARRNKIKANHSATHLLHNALRSILGQHVMQKGSIITAEKLRFDFTHPRALSIGELNRIECTVNQEILNNVKAYTNIMPTVQAIESGAIGLFGEKYGETVRVVTIGNSIELCGGTHVTLTGDIGLFKIVSEDSIASGVRRIEALTGLAALDFCNTKQNILNELSLILKCAEQEIKPKVLAMYEAHKAYEKDILKCKAKLAYATAKFTFVNNIHLVCQHSAHASIQELKYIVDALRAKIENGVIIVSSDFNGKAFLIINIVGEAKEYLKANELIKNAIECMNAKGGGNAELAQIGNGNLMLLEEALAKIKSNITNAMP